MKKCFPILILFLVMSTAAFSQVTVDNTIRVFSSDNLFVLSAKLADKATGNPAPHIRGYASYPGQRFNLYTSVSDSSGNIKFLTTSAEKGRPVIFQTDNRVDSIYQYILSKPLIEAYPSDDSISSDVAEADTLSFYGLPDKSYTLDDYTRFPTLEEVFREFIIEVRARKVKNDYRFSVLNTPYRLYFEENPLVLLDGVPVFDYQQLMLLDPLKIRKIDVVARKYFYGSLVCNGIVSFQTYAGDLAGYVLHSSALATELKEVPVSSK